MKGSRKANTQNAKHQVCTAEPLSHPKSSQVQIILNFCSSVMITNPVFVIECEITWTAPAKVVQRSLVNCLETLSYLVFYLIVICKIK